MKTAFDLVPADTVAAEQLHATFSAAFADYLIGPFQQTLAQWPAFLGRQGVDVGLSRAAIVGGEVVAFALVAARPECDSWRLATMGALPAARGTGAAAALLDDFLARARAAGVAAAELECFAQNTRALRLYQGRGFAVVDALHGYRHTAPPGAAASLPAAAISLDDAFDWLHACIEAGCGLPLQVTPRSLLALPVRLQAWRLGSAQLVFSQDDEGRVQVHSLVDRDAAQLAADQLLAALLARFPGCALHVPQLQLHAVGGAALQRAGFERLPLHQVWMRRGLRG
jgi:ribosomal protein S18 acetylase RimI-like enzyme